jgi:hypothetical protein
MPGVLKLEENTLSVVVLDIFCDLFFCRGFSPSANRQLQRVGVEDVLPFSVQVTASAPQAAERLLAICPDVAELLAVMALRKTILSSICLYPYCDVAED